jgi:hypothetical protein
LRQQRYCAAFMGAKSEACGCTLPSVGNFGPAQQVQQFAREPEGADDGDHLAQFCRRVAPCGTCVRRVIAAALGGESACAGRVRR